MERNNTLNHKGGGAATNRECPQCGEDSLSTYWHSDTFEYGTGDSAAALNVELPVRRCGSCDLEFIDHEGQRLRHEAVCRHLGVLTPADIAGVRKRYGMSRAAFAEATGLGEATLGRWENGAVVQNAANDRYLRLLALPGVMENLRRITAAPRVSEPQTSNVRPFRAIEVSTGLLKRKEQFQLRRAS